MCILLHLEPFLIEIDDGGARFDKFGFANREIDMFHFGAVNFFFSLPGFLSFQSDDSHAKYEDNGTVTQICIIFMLASRKQLHYGQQRDRAGVKKDKP